MNISNLWKGFVLEPLFEGKVAVLEGSLLDPGILKGGQKVGLGLIQNLDLGLFQGEGLLKRWLSANSSRFRASVR